MDIILIQSAYNKNGCSQNVFKAPFGAFNGVADGKDPSYQSNDHQT